MEYLESNKAWGHVVTFTVGDCDRVSFCYWARYFHKICRDAITVMPNLFEIRRWAQKLLETWTDRQTGTDTTYAIGTNPLLNSFLKAFMHFQPVWDSQTGMFYQPNDVETSVDVWMPETEMAQ